MTIKTNINADIDIMRLVHYFVTKENYSPIYVHGVKDEIWLEKLDGPYRIIRINSNRIFNDEQFKYDQYKIKDILKQIKKKTMSFSVNALNINLNEDEDVNNEKSFKNVDTINVKSLSDIDKNEKIIEIFPNIKGNLIEDANGLELIFNITQDINEKTSKDNQKFERIFSPKKVFVTPTIIAINIILYIMLYIFGDGPTIGTLVKSKVFQGIVKRFDEKNNLFVKFGANNVELLKMGEVWRLFTYAFLHGSLIHILCNMYSLYIIGNQIETKFGKWRFILIYVISAISGGLLSAGMSNTVSIGASGAIFGTLGALLYFGMHFRLYFREALKSSIIPVIIINLLLGFMLPGIDNAGHIGGLVAGYLSAMALGIPEEKNKKDTINGCILLLIFILFLGYIVFFR